MRITLTLTVDRSDAGRPLAEWLTYMLVDETRASVLAGIREGRVAIDRRPVTDPSAPLPAGAEVAFQEADPDGAPPSWPSTGSAGEITRVPKD